MRQSETAERKTDSRARRPKKGEKNTQSAAAAAKQNEMTLSRDNAAQYNPTVNATRASHSL
eukprot:scaffold116408_cov24-Attheya_sp.AAC.1